MKKKYLINFLTLIVLATTQIQILCAQKDINKAYFEKTTENISIVLKNQDFLKIDFLNASFSKIESFLKDVKKPEFLEQTEKQKIKISSKFPISLKSYKKNEKEIEASKRIQQAYTYLKNSDLSSFKKIILDVILRYHFTLAAAQGSFLIAWSLIEIDKQNPYRYMDEALTFFDYIINAHRYSKYSDASFVVLIPWLLRKDFQSTKKLLETYIDLQGKIEKVDWTKELDIKKEQKNTFISIEQSKKITNIFLNAMIGAVKMEIDDLQVIRQRMKRKKIRNRVRKYLDYIQKNIKK